MLTNKSITFGKYKGSTLGHVLKDRNYCSWLLDQEWFENNYEYLYNRIKSYTPLSFFLKENLVHTEDFIDRYRFFNLKDTEDIQLPLTISEKTCYSYYLELLDEIKIQQGFITNKLIKKFIENYPKVEGRKQVGESTFYEKRTPKDSELDINKTIKEQFNLLRIVDNERYPAYFTLKGKRYTLNINKVNE